MKIFFLATIFCFCLLSTTNAQIVKGDIFASAYLGFGKPVGKITNSAKGGLSYNASGGYFINNRVAVGVDYSGVLAGRFDTSYDTGFLGISIFALENYSLKGWYFLNNKKVTPYVAMGLGIAKFDEGEITIADQTIKGAKRYAPSASPEIGISLNGFNLSFAFILSGKAPKEPVFYPIIADAPVNYYRFNIGYMYDF